jgi:predicted enzyme related to lactoylglutathione lyase
LSDAGAAPQGPRVDPGRLCQIEIAVSDLARATQFYAAAFGWRAMPAELHECVVLEVPADCKYGMSLVPRRGAGATGSNVVVYFSVDDVEAVVARVEAAGGRRRFGPMRLPGYGQIYQVEDPDGTRFGLYDGREA